MCIHVCTSMYAGGSLTEPRQPSRMSTNRSGIEDAGIESSDYHAPAEPEDPIGMARADCFHSMLYPLMYIHMNIHTKICLIPTHGGRHSDFFGLLTIKWVVFVSSLSCQIRAFVAGRLRDGLMEPASVRMLSISSTVSFTNIICALDMVCRYVCRSETNMCNIRPPLR